ncbi:Beta-catenin-like protein 1 [Intoshia linei]|uniref:Beta-catenin-like protein 1 n=1 Tax=Intoshia linei TaxID=1819745 RepID=A0A177B8W6_9BILA|nr:Beta-catenin-like protein 1 [Intoshia linei]
MNIDELLQYHKAKSDDIDSSHVEVELNVLEVKRLISLLQKKYAKNQEMRIKFKETPEKFMESEVLLNDAIHCISILSTSYHLYPNFVDLGGLTLFFKLLRHENTDIITSTIEVLNDLIDLDDVVETDQVDNFNMLIDPLADLNIFDVLLHCIGVLDDRDRDECSAIFKCLEITENLIEYDSKFIKLLCDQNMVNWIVKKLRTFKRRNPRTVTEYELMFNVFNCLCASFVLKENKKLFLDGEGIELMVLMMREKKVSRFGALNVINHILSDNDSAPYCDRFIDALGLRSIFSVFMSTPVCHNKSGPNKLEIEEHVLSIICSLLKKSTDPSRLLDKFTENNYEKIERLIEFFVEYRDIIEKQKLKHLNNQEQYVELLGLGLFTLQQIVIILGIITKEGHTKMKNKIKSLLSIKNCKMQYIKKILEQHANNVDTVNEQNTETCDGTNIIANCLFGLCFTIDVVYLRKAGFVITLLASIMSILSLIIMMRKEKSDIIKFYLLLMNLALIIGFVSYATLNIAVFFTYIRAFNNCDAKRQQFIIKLAKDLLMLDDHFSFDKIESRKKNAIFVGLLSGINGLLIIINTVHIFPNKSKHVNINQ